MPELEYYNLIKSGNLSPDQLHKEKEYKKYVDTHINNVQTTYARMKNNYSIMEFLYNNISDISQLDNQIAVHDMSKYGPYEWEAYRRNFYPVDEQEKINNKEAFDNAWKHHYMNNPHHWNYWYETDTTEEMSFRYIVEMVCDWCAMTIVFGGSTIEWYKSQKDIVLGHEQKKWVEELLNLYDDGKVK